MKCPRMCSNQRHTSWERRVPESVGGLLPLTTLDVLWPPAVAHGVLAEANHSTWFAKAACIKELPKSSAENRKVDGGSKNGEVNIRDSGLQ